MAQCVYWLIVHNINVNKLLHEVSIPLSSHPLQQVEGTGGVSGEPQALDKYSLYVVRNFIEMTKGTSCVYISYYILS